MSEKIQKVVVLGGGCTGFLAAICLRRLVPSLTVTLVNQPEEGVVGDAESTTSPFTQFLHSNLGLDWAAFHRQVQPSWKIGVRMEWGDPQNDYFNYPYDRCMDDGVGGLEKNVAYYSLNDIRGVSLISSVMDQCRSPLTARDGKTNVHPNTAYHLKHEKLIDYLSKLGVELGVEVVDGRLDQAVTSNGSIDELLLADGFRVTGDLFVDCTGIQSLLLGQAIDEKRVSYAAALPCDAAVFGSWKRADDEQELRPYTTVRTLDHGWSWQIDFLDDISCGYLFSSEFCSVEDATAELRQQHPQLGDELPSVECPSSRLENFWSGNVVAIGHAAGFVDPMQGTALQTASEQLRTVCLALRDGDYRLVPALRDVANRRYRETWDDVRDFLAILYRYNNHRDTAFWRRCRESTPLGQAAEVVEFFAEAGPSPLAKSILAPRVFDFDAVMNSLVCLRIPTEARRPFTAEEETAWTRQTQALAKLASQALPMREALQRVLAGK